MVLVMVWNVLNVVVMYFDLNLVLLVVLIHIIVVYVSYNCMINIYCITKYRLRKILFLLLSMIHVADWIKFLTFYDTIDAYLGGILLFVIQLHLITSIASVLSGISLYSCHIYDIVVQVQHKHEYGVPSVIFFCLSNDVCYQLK